MWRFPDVLRVAPKIAFAGGDEADTLRVPNPPGANPPSDERVSDMQGKGQESACIPK